MANDPADARQFAIDLADTADFTLADLQIRPAMRTIAAGGRQHVLQPRVMQVLVALADGHPAVISRDRLIARCWGGRIVGDDALNRCIVALRHLMRDLGCGLEIENVARVGYRLVVSPASGGSPETRKSYRLVITGACFGVAALGLFAAYTALQPPTAKQPLARETTEAQRLRTAAQAMLRTGNPQVAGDARVLLRQAIAVAPGYAPAWASLGEAIAMEASLRGPDHVIATLPQARAAVRRALALSPDLADAHGRLGALLGYTGADAQRELFRAASLAPETAQGQLWLATARRASGDFAGEIAAYRRAHALDANWYRPVRDLAIATAEMGDRPAALKIASSAKAPFPGCAGMPARIAWIFGDMAEAARCAAETARVESIWAAPARVVLGTARLTLGLSRDAAAAAPIHLIDTRPPQGRIWMESAPASAEWERHNRSADAALVYRIQNLVGAKLMLNAGRHAELAASYDGPVGLLGLRRNTVIRAADLPAVAVAAMALQRSGRAADADALLTQAQRVVDDVHSRGPAPFTFDVDAAALAAVRGRRDVAVAELRRARSRGWVNNNWSDLLKLGDEPAFVSLHDHAGFRVILAELDAIYAREKARAIRFGI